MDTSTMSAVAHRLTREHFRQGEVIFSPGDAGDCIYLVVEGKVSLSRRSRDGVGCLATLAGPTEMFGELSTFDSEPRSSEARALTPVVAMTLNRQTIHWWIAQESEAAQQLLRVLARQMRKATRKVADVPHSDVAARVAAQLLDLAQRFGTQDGDSVSVEHGLSQHQLAELVGTSRESICHVLHELEKRGFIRVRGGSITIYDCEALSLHNHVATGAIS
ncbi:hypothetical protein BKG68_19260 [Mycobacteroides saopaulense]|uniref:Crp/Fnr family transcriptional regulator n=2 Tax=Mycobacteroides saopaulense TaxID=1578165 RepID=A0ABX3C157_9MYCO|nr:hypothetical protein BKG68_19260 [Mycobacteroides saopaulense]OHU10238.1 hypothetical protein BKG73_10065 [Mycobacteroides saopaulense]